MVLPGYQNETRPLNMPMKHAYKTHHISMKFLEDCAINTRPVKLDVIAIRDDIIVIQHDVIVISTECEKSIQSMEPILKIIPAVTPHQARRLCYR